MFYYQVRFRVGSLRSLSYPRNLWHDTLCAPHPSNNGCNDGTREPLWVREKSDRAFKNQPEPVLPTTSCREEGCTVPVRIWGPSERPFVGGVGVAALQVTSAPGHLPVYVKYARVLTLWVNIIGEFSEDRDDLHSEVTPLTLTLDHILTVVTEL